MALEDDQRRLPMPSLLHLSGESISRHGQCTSLIVSSPDPGLYLLTNGQEIYLWVGRGLAANFIEDVFGVMVYEAIPEDMVRVPVSLEPALTHVQTKLPALETTMSKKVRNIVTGLRNAHHRYMILRIIKEDSKHRHLVTRYLVRLAASSV